MVQKKPIVFLEYASKDIEKSAQFSLDTLEWSIEFNDSSGVTFAMLQPKNQE